MARLVGRWLAVMALLALVACGGDGGGGGATEVNNDADAGQEPGDAGDDADRPDADPGDVPDADPGDVPVEDEPDDMEPPIEPAPAPPDATATPESMGRGFQLYYKERVERVVTAYQRFFQFGGATFSTNIGTASIHRAGDTFVVIPNPRDNNEIGRSIWMTYHARRQVSDARALDLALMRMFNGLVYFAEVTGVQGLTSREVLPGWTRVMDGAAGEVTLSRFGAPVAGHPSLGGDEPALGQEILDTFYEGIHVTYRENPAEFYFNFLPLVRPVRYATTYSISALPDFLRVSDCCSSLKRTPDEHLWGGAFWGNHNSRDNFPDLALGYLAAMAAAQDDALPQDVREAAARAVAAGHDIGDLIIDSGSNLMTIDEYSPYGELVVGGTIRPHGDPENQDLGSMGACSMAYLAQALSTEGLSLDEGPLPLPGSADRLIFGSGLLDSIIDCPLPEGVTMCGSILDGYCGRQWGAFERIELLGQPFFEYLETTGLGPTLLGSFQNDFDDVVESMVALYHYGQITGQPELAAKAREGVFHMTRLQQTMADLAYPDDERRRAERRHQAAAYSAQTALPHEAADLGGLEDEEQAMRALERLLTLGDTVGGLPELTNEGLRAEVEADLRGGRESIARRFEEVYGDDLPIRVTEEGVIEARGWPEDEHPWQALDLLPHVTVGNPRYMSGMVLCETAPHVLDCTWARLGCQRPDLNRDGTVDEADRAAFSDASAAAEAPCDEADGWCGGADLDRDGAIGDLDAAFMDAAQGCTWTP